MKIGALLRVAVDQICSAGRRPLAYLDGCPCSASPVSAAGSGSAAQPTTAPCFVHRTRSLCLPLALSRFLRRGTAPACKNRSAAPASPRCFCRRQRSAQLPPAQMPSLYETAAGSEGRCRGRRKSARWSRLCLGAGFDDKSCGIVQTML